MPPRTKNAAATRDKLLAAARARFLAESYENVGLRDIAGDAGVDVALVGRYFGSKEELFKEVLREGKVGLIDPSLDAAALPAFLARLVTEDQSAGGREDIEKMLIILRSASSPKAAQVVRDSLREDVLGPIATIVGGEEAEMKASLCMSVLMGTTILRKIMSVEPLCVCDVDLVRENLARLLAASLT